MRGPRGRRHEVAVGDRGVDGNVGVLAAGQLDLGRAGRIRGDALAADHVRGREQLRGVTDRGDRFAGFGELPHDVDDFRIEPQILGRAPAGNRERIVLTRIGVFERCVQREQMPRLFGVGLIALEIMNRGLDPVAGLLVRAHRIDHMSDCLQRLKRHHRFVILGEIAGEKQNLLCRHRMPPVGQGNTANARLRWPVYRTSFDRTATASARRARRFIAHEAVVRQAAATAYDERVFVKEAASRGSHTHMNSSIRSPLLRRAAVVLFVFGGLAACQKNDASAGQVAGKLNDAAQAASQKLDQAASYVGQKVDETKSAAQQNIQSASAPTVTIDPNALASSAQANLQNAASAAQAQLGKAASLTGESLENAGRKLQQWSAQSSASSTSAAASSSGSGYGGDAQKQMDK